MSKPSDLIEYINEKSIYEAGEMGREIQAMKAALSAITGVLGSGVVNSTTAYPITSDALLAQQWEQWYQVNGQRVNDNNNYINVTIQTETQQYYYQVAQGLGGIGGQAPIAKPEEVFVETDPLVSGPRRMEI